MSTRSPEPRSEPLLEHRELGAVDFDTAWALQRQVRDRLVSGEGKDLLFTLEHSPPVLTGGRRADPADLLVSRAELERRGVLIRKIERGGSWTWHGPGQLVAYSVVALRRWNLRVPAFVEGLEGAMLELTRWALTEAGVDVDTSGLVLGRRCGFPGAWLRRRDGRLAKIGAVGLHFRRFVSLHGMAWNLDPDPWGFDLVHPCGLTDEVTSVRRLAGELGGDAARVPSREAAGLRLAGILPLWWRGSGGRRAPVLD